MNDDDVLSHSPFVDVIVALVLFCEENGDQAIPIKQLKSLLDHYNI